MNENKQPPKPRPEGIRVKNVKFVSPTDIPGAPLPTALKSREPGATNKSGHEIEYLPHLRHHRIAWFEANQSEPTRVAMVPESRVLTWEPA